MKHGAGLTLDEENEEWANPNAGGWAEKLDPDFYDAALEVWNAFENELEVLEHKCERVSVVLLDFDDLLRRDPMPSLTLASVRLMVPVLLMTKSAHVALEDFEDSFEAVLADKRATDESVGRAFRKVVRQGLAAVDDACSPADAFHLLCAISVPAFDDYYIGLLSLLRQEAAVKLLQRLKRRWQDALSKSDAELGIDIQTRRGAELMLDLTRSKLAGQGFPNVL